MAQDFKAQLKSKMDEYVHSVYAITKKFPKEEMFGSISQIRRASLSVILNYLEGYARRKPLTQLNFLEISFGSLKETQYLLFFALNEKWILKEEYERIFKIGDSIGAMLWTEITNLDKGIN